MEPYNQDLTVVDVAWSPTGQANNKGYALKLIFFIFRRNASNKSRCILSVLTSRGEVLFYESWGNTKIPRWEMVRIPATMDRSLLTVNRPMMLFLLCAKAPKMED